MHAHRRQCLSNLRSSRPDRHTPKPPPPRTRSRLRPRLLGRLRLLPCYQHGLKQQPCSPLRTLLPQPLPEPRSDRTTRHYASRHPCGLSTTSCRYRSRLHRPLGRLLLGRHRSRHTQHILGLRRIQDNQPLPRLVNTSRRNIIQRQLTFPNFLPLFLPSKTTDDYTVPFWHVETEERRTRNSNRRGISLRSNRAQWDSESR